MNISDDLYKLDEVSRIYGPAYSRSRITDH